VLKKELLFWILYLNYLHLKSLLRGLDVRVIQIKLVNKFENKVRVSDRHTAYRNIPCTLPRAEAATSFDASSTIPPFA
jgi:hypothetical protein